MGIMDTIQGLNPFKKKEEFSFAPEQQPAFESHPMDQGQQGLDYGHPNLDQPGFNAGTSSFQNHIPPEQQQPDSRMNMPLGDNVRQGRMNAMYEQEPERPAPRDNTLHKELELISSKLDYLKASLESINQRLVNLEHMEQRQLPQDSRRW